MNNTYIRKMRYFILIFSFFLFNSVLHAQNTISGSIKNSSNKAIEGVYVHLKNTKFKTLTNSNGLFLLQNVPSGEYLIVIESLNNEVLTKKIKISNNVKNLFEFILNDKINTLENVNVFGKINGENESNARTQEKKSNALQNIVSAKVMERSPDINAANVLQRISGVTLSKNSGSDEAFAIVRGLEPRYNNTLINGVKIASPDEKSRFVSLSVVPSELLQKIEVNKTLIPEMEGDAIGGSVNLVMKDAPDLPLFKATTSLGYSSIFFNQDFVTFSKKDIQQNNLTDRFGKSYIAQPNDFSRSNLDLKKGDALPTGTLGLTLGRRFMNNKLGILISNVYQNQYYGTNSVNNQAVPDIYKNQPTISDIANRSISTQQLNNGLTIHADYNFNDNNKIIITNVFLYSYLAQARITIDTALIGGNGGRTVPGTGPVYKDYQSITDQQYIENIKLEGKHNLSKKLQFDWATVYSSAQKQTPDRADLSINKKIDTVHTSSSFNSPYTFINTPYYFDNISRIWQHNNDQDINALFNLTYRGKINEISIELKTGGLFRHKTRYNIQNEYDLKPTTNSNGVKQAFNDIYSANWIVYNTSGTQSYDINNYKLFEDVGAGFLQSKIAFKKLDIFGGIRYETTNQGFTLNTFYPTGINGVTKEYSDLLPSLLFKYKLTLKTNIRLSYFKSIARPNYYELVPSTLLSNSSPTSETGNPDLKHSVANNFDVRYEFFPKGDEQFFLGAFYKEIKDPIEYAYINISNYKPQNLGTATLYGTEFVYTKYFGNFGLSGNYTYIISNISSPKFYTNVLAGTTEPNRLQSRPMQGQTDHTLNLSILYKNDKKGFYTQVSYQYLGKTLAQVYPVYGYDYYQSPQSFLSASAEQQLNRTKFIIFGKFNNLLNTASINKINNLLVRKDIYNSNFSIGIRYNN